MITELLQEGVLNDSVIMYPDKGKVFKGQYIAIIKEYRFLNEWNNQEQVKRFRTEESLEKYLAKNYPNY
jgi:hypothetical protein